MAGPLRQCVVASRNPVKVEAAQRAIDRVFPTGLFAKAEGVAAPSGVSDQPFSDAETLAGARNRVAALRPSHPDALIMVESTRPRREGRRTDWKQQGGRGRRAVRRAEEPGVLRLVHRRRGRALSGGEGEVGLVPAAEGGRRPGGGGDGVERVHLSKPGTRRY